MESKRNYRLCDTVFFVVIGALMIQGVQKTNKQEDTHYALEEDVVSVEKRRRRNRNQQKR